MDRNEARKVLGLPAHFSKQQLREAYLEKVRIHHPDLNGDSNSATMGQINAAKTVLTKLPAPEYGIAGAEVWSDLRSWREVAQAAEDNPTAAKTPSVGLIGRLTRRNRSRVK
jgi:curved DNA-binding protein CbpA